MKASKLFRVICTASIVSACAFALSACATSETEEKTPTVEGLTGGVAATVNGVEIQEDDVTTRLQNYRESASLMDEDNWGQYLVDNDYTPETVREEIINYFAGQELIRQAGEENGIKIDSSEIDEYVAKMRAYYNSDEEWATALEAAGTTEDAYRDSLELALLEQKLKEEVAVAEAPTDEELLEAAQMYAPAYDGAKKSSHILFESSDAALAQEVLDKLNAGELDFATAATEYSTDSSASNGGNVGWDVLNSFVTEYTAALDVLNKDEISGLVTSDYGIHIIKCTDVFVAPETVTDINQLPEEFLDSIRSSLETTGQSEAYNTWYTEYKEAADIVINDMPEDVPYNVDLSKYTKTETEEDISIDDGTENAEGETTEGDLSEDVEGEATAEEENAESAVEDQTSEQPAAA